ncbi:MAG: efflux RND transporter periplasmic adaptor subunit [Thermodesulfobacteriota bacterium]
MKKVLALVLSIATAAAAWAYFNLGAENQTFGTYKTAKVQRGSITTTVTATGNLNAVKTVLVGTQVSGRIQEIYVDFNSPVTKGQPVAQIDAALLEAQVEQARGAYLVAEANLEKAKVAAAEAKRAWERNRQMVGRGVIAQSEFDALQAAYDSARAAVKAAEGSVVQTRGAYDQARANLAYSTIRSPVDGIVVSRNVDVGQTVAASFQTPTLFTIVQDLAEMQIETNVDEADIGRVRENQTAYFTVDAYPDRRFEGRVVQIRNSPQVTQNVVTYIVIIEVANQNLLLKPGLTANVVIETARKDNVLTLPVAALRFRPKTGARDEGSGSGPSARPVREGPGQRVYVPDRDRAPRPVTVRTGLGGDGRVELLSGNLKEGDEVIIEQSPPKKTGGMGLFTGAGGF